MTHLSIQKYNKPNLDALSSWIMIRIDRIIKDWGYVVDMWAWADGCTALIDGGWGVLVDWVGCEGGSGSGGPGVVQD